MWVGCALHSCCISVSRLSGDLYLVPLCLAQNRRSFHTNFNIRAAARQEKLPGGLSTTGQIKVFVNTLILENSALVFGHLDRMPQILWVAAHSHSYWVWSSQRCGTLSLHEFGTLSVIHKVRVTFYKLLNKIPPLYMHTPIIHHSQDSQRSIIWLNSSGSLKHSIWDLSPLRVAL